MLEINVEAIQNSVCDSTPFFKRNRWEFVSTVEYINLYFYLIQPRKKKKLNTNWSHNRKKKFARVWIECDWGNLHFQQQRTGISRHANKFSKVKWYDRCYEIKYYINCVCGKKQQ